MFFAGQQAAGETFPVHLQKRNAETGEVQTEVRQWSPKETAIVVCDMWNQHWCKGATARVGEMAPRMNEVLTAARDKGITIFHAPSECMKFYENHPAHKRALGIPADETVKNTLGGEKWNGGLPSEKDKKYPLDQSDGGCDCEPKCKGGQPWRSEIAALMVDENKDFVTDSGVTIGSYLKQHGIKNVIVMGVHTNMCVIGRPFGLRQQICLGNNTVLMRDMTDTMYNHQRSPFVSHFKGTDLIIEYIEQYICPSMVSADFTGKERFYFNGAK
ncbi:MAG: cysteine hydrolase [Planctomycetaceae bacterium]|jgi:nicotinamidase-related amidase|nr:cysteine hydrolase [Planctomycetaceae bacterium]